MHKPVRVVLLVALIVCFDARASAPEVDELVERGRYVFNAAGCISCHTQDQPLAGGRAIETPVGTFYGPNITPDMTHGIGNWTEDDFIQALRQGTSPSGEHYYPAFPYSSYTRMTSEDMSALWAYLKSQPAYAKPDQPHDLLWFLHSRALLEPWKAGHFAPGQFSADLTKSLEWNRGAYIASALGHCGECHTPRGLLGGPLNELYLGGTREGPDGARIPNITPDARTGIGWWTLEDLTVFLSTGRRPDGSYTQGLMAEVLATSILPLSDYDRYSLAVFLRSVRPVHHDIDFRIDPFRQDD
jgi:mono/diheme cytochrome c family protein